MRVLLGLLIVGLILIGAMPSIAHHVGLLLETGIHLLIGGASALLAQPAVLLIGATAYLIRRIA